MNTCRTVFLINVHGYWPTFYVAAETPLMSANVEEEYYVPEGKTVDMAGSYLQDEMFRETSRQIDQTLVELRGGGEEGREKRAAYTSNIFRQVFSAIIMLL